MMHQTTRTEKRCHSTRDFRHCYKLNLSIIALSLYAYNDVLLWPCGLVQSASDQTPQTTTLRITTTNTATQSEGLSCTIQHPRRPSKHKTTVSDVSTYNHCHSRQNTESERQRLVDIHLRPVCTYLWVRFCNL